MRRYDTMENFIYGLNMPSKIIMELDESRNFYNVKMYLKVKYNDEIYNAIVETKEKMLLNQFEMVYDTDKGDIWTITIQDENN